MTATMHYDNKAKVKADANLPLSEHVTKVLSVYFEYLDGQLPENLYALVIQEVEQPLLEMVMHYVGNNQSKAAAILGINRGTFRKKLAVYNML